MNKTKGFEYGRYKNYLTNLVRAKSKQHAKVVVLDNIDEDILIVDVKEIKGVKKWVHMKLN